MIEISGVIRLCSSKSSKYQTDSDLKETRRVLEAELAPKLGLPSNDLAVWYGVSLAQLIRIGAKPLLEKYKYSFPNLLSSTYPEHAWSMDRFEEGNSSKGKLRVSTWNDRKNLRAFLEFVGELMGLKPFDYNAWYKVSVVDIIKFGGKDLLEEKKYSLPEILRSSFPEHIWNRDAFQFRPRVTPSDHLISRTRKILEKLGTKLSIEPENYEPWYSVPYLILEQEIGTSDLGKFQYSRYTLFSTVFPEHKWLPWQFAGMKFSANWTQRDRIDLAKFLEAKLGLKKPEDWYGVNRRDLTDLHLYHLFQSQADFIQFLVSVYPEIKWDPEKMAWSSFGQSHLRATLAQLFPGGVFLSKAFFAGENLQSLTLTDRILVVPSKKLIFEYQGPISYVEQIVAERTNLSQTCSDSLEAFAKARGFTLICIPFWWNRERNTLLGTLWKAKRDLFEGPDSLANLKQVASSSEPIPESVPRNQKNLNKGYLKKWAHDPRFDRFFSAPKASKGLGTI